MTAKILFVDDEQSLLNGIERRLGMEFDIVTACSGSDGLKEIETNGPFAVIVTDMQMPEMNGIQFIQNARKLSPDTVYIMLTGNQDLTTASNAVNEGKVFRFLNKPCDTDDLKRAIEIALRQYRLVTGEKELLHKTFVGAVGVLTDVLEISQPHIFSQMPKIEQTFEILREGLGVTSQWEFKLASRLGLLGFAMISEGDRQCFEHAMSTTEESLKSFNQAASIGGRLIKKIPRLATVAEIIEKQAEVDGSLPATDSSVKVDIVRLGSTFLRISMQWTFLKNSGVSNEAAITEIFKVLPNLSAEIADVLLSINEQEEPLPSVEVEVCDLREKMILAEDIITEDGAILLRKGRPLSWTVIEKLHLRKTQGKPMRPIQIVESSCEATNRVVVTS